MTGTAQESAASAKKPLPPSAGDQGSPAAQAALDKVQRQQIQDTMLNYLKADMVVSKTSEITHSQAPIAADEYRDHFREKLRALDAANPHISAAIYPYGEQGVTVDVEGNVVLYAMKGSQVKSHLMLESERTEAVRNVEAFVKNNNLNAVRKGLDAQLKDQTSFTFKNVAAVVTKNGKVLLATPEGGFEVLTPNSGEEVPSQQVGTRKSSQKAVIKP